MTTCSHCGDEYDPTLPSATPHWCGSCMRRRQRARQRALRRLKANHAEEYEGMFREELAIEWDFKSELVSR